MELSGHRHRASSDVDVRPLQKTASGNKYIVAATDHFNKWSEAATIPANSAECVANFFLVQCAGLDAWIPSSVTKAESSSELLINILTSISPTVNGQYERDNCTLKNVLAKMVNKNGNNWNELIPGVLFAYHTSIHSSIKMKSNMSTKVPEDGKINPDTTEVLKAIHQTIRENVLRSSMTLSTTTSMFCQ